MKKIRIKTIDIQAREWFDKVNGNSYFSAVVTINYGMPNELVIELPFQYGYGDHYVDMAKQKLIEMKLIKVNNMVHLWSYCKENKIILRYSKQTNCKKRDL